ncbi:MAG: hypothetical protein ACLFNO_00470 [Parcubacteria group bacterium]
MKKNNIFYLFVVGIFLTLSALSFYWFNNVNTYTETNKSNNIVENSANIWYKFNSILDFLDIIGNNSSNQAKGVDMLDNPIENSANVLSTFKIDNELEQEIEYQEGSISPSFNELVEEKQLKEKTWYKKYSQWISQKGFYTFKKENLLEVGWQNSLGKTYSISIPF